MPFPCGPNLEKLAEKSSKTFKIKPCIRDLNCALSGLQNQAEKMNKQGENPADIAKYCLDFVGASIDGVCKNARDIYPEHPFVFAGGVMSNKKLNELLSKKYNGLFAEPKYSSDNAAGAAILCKTAYDRNLSEYTF